MFTAHSVFDTHFLELFWNYVNGDLSVKSSMCRHLFVKMEHRGQWD